MERIWGDSVALAIRVDVPFTVQIPAEVAAALDIQHGEELDVDFFPTVAEAADQAGWSEAPAIIITKK